MGDGEVGGTDGELLSGGCRGLDVRFSGWVLTPLQEPISSQTMHPQSSRCSNPFLLLFPFYAPPTCTQPTYVRSPATPRKRPVSTLASTYRTAVPSTSLPIRSIRPVAPPAPRPAPHQPRVRSLQRHAQHSTPPSLQRYSARVHARPSDPSDLTAPLRTKRSAAQSIARQHVLRKRDDDVPVSATLVLQRLSRTVWGCK